MNSSTGARVGAVVAAAIFTVAVIRAAAPAKPEPATPGAPKPNRPKVAPAAPRKPAPVAPAGPAAYSLNTDRPAALLPGLGHLHHPITARVPDAQSFFDQGLLFGFAFNEEEAARSFKRAATIDSQAAMAFWGVAWSLGP